MKREEAELLIQSQIKGPIVRKRTGPQLHLHRPCFIVLAYHILTLRPITQLINKKFT